MGVDAGALWELQWHPAGGGKVRRIVLTRRGLRRILVTAGAALVLVLAIVGILPIGLKGLLSRFTVEAARRENHALHAQRDTLHELANRLAGRLHAQVQRARRMAWAVGAAPAAWRAACDAAPAVDADDETMARWLAAVGSRLDDLGELFASPPHSPLCPLAALPLTPPVDMTHAVAVSLFGWRTSPFTGKTMAQHGITLAAPLGEPVLAPGAGRVVFAGSARERRANEWTRYGNVVVLDHGGGVLTVFGHLKDVAVKRGQSVARAQAIGTAGQTGWTKVPALYYEVRWPIGAESRPIDPALVTLALPIENLDARLAAPAGDLPQDYAQLGHLTSGAGGREPGQAHHQR